MEDTISCVPLTGDTGPVIPKIPQYCTIKGTVITKKYIIKLFSGKALPKSSTDKISFLSCLTVSNHIVWRKEIDFKLQTSTPFFETEMPEALVNMFIHMGICKTERVAWALKLSSFHLQERRDGKCG